MDTRTLKKIYNKLSQEDKTELSTEKVELQSQEDLRNALDSLDGSIRTLEGDFQTFKSLRNRVQNESSNGEERVKQIKSIIIELKQAAKKYGLDDNVFPDIKRAERAINNFESITQGRAKLGGLLSL